MTNQQELLDRIRALEDDAERYRWLRDQGNFSYMYSMPPQEHVHPSFYAPPPVVGYWVFPGSKKGYETKFSMTAKPNWFHRLTMKWALGWVWEDVK